MREEFRGIGAQGNVGKTIGSRSVGTKACGEPIEGDKRSYSAANFPSRSNRKERVKKARHMEHVEIWQYVKLRVVPSVT